MFAWTESGAIPTPLSNKSLTFPSATTALVPPPPNMSRPTFPKSLGHVLPNECRVYPTSTSYKTHPTCAPPHRGVTWPNCSSFCHQVRLGFGAHPGRLRYGWSSIAIERVPKPQGSSKFDLKPTSK